MRAQVESIAGKPAVRSARPIRRHARLRVLVASEDARARDELGAQIAKHCAPAVAIAVGDVPSAVEALVIRHPDLLVTDVHLPGHPQGGFRLILDAVSVGVPTIVISQPVSRSLKRRLAELGVAWLHKKSDAAAVVAAVHAALARRPRPRIDRAPDPPPRPLFESA